ncbi:MAG: histidine kinase dimerization/phospho-acceptor domain-containing protein [Ruminococcus callidus]
MVKLLSDSFSRQKQFISNAGHELKTPVTVISATTDLLERKHGSDCLYDTIKAQSEKMSG